MKISAHIYDVAFQALPSHPTQKKLHFKKIMETQNKREMTEFYKSHFLEFLKKHVFQYKKLELISFLPSQMH